jgi:HlyD family secretion protein
VKKLWIGIAVAAAIGLVVFASLRGGGGRAKVKIYAEAATRRDLTRVVKASGQINPRIKVNISAHVIGKISRLFVKEGDRIEVGKPFLELEKQAFTAFHDDAAARLAMAETEQHQAEVAAADAAVKLARANRLSGEGISSKEALEAATLAKTSADLRVEQAREGVNQAQAALVKAKDDLTKTTIFAPLTGRVIALNAEEGEVVVSGTMNNPASVIGTIADLSEILAEVDVDETEVVLVQPGQTVKVDVDAVRDHSYRGKVVEVGSSGFSRPQQPDVMFFKVKVLLEDPDDRLRPGMSTRSEIQVSSRSGAIAVPIQAVLDREPLSAPAAGGAAAPQPAAGDDKKKEVPVVFVVEAGKVRQRSVEVGISDSTHVEILSGVAEGDKVATGPYRITKKLKDGDPVKVTDPKTEGEATTGTEKEAD